jgi:RHS repeat-associated protein
VQTRPTFQRRLGAAALVTAYVSQLSQLAIAEGGGGGTGAPPPPPSYPQSAIVASNAPIRLPGSGGVDDTGGAHYAMPLWVPDGPRGMEPVLSLGYAGGGNGSLGVGFGLGGLSAIEPCGKSVAAEGYADNADFGVGELLEEGTGDFSTDVYCLDGEKLVPFTAPGFVMPTTGHPRSYHTEVESFRHVVAHHAVVDEQPEKFEVHLGDGTVRTYEPVYGHILVFNPQLGELEPSPKQVAIVYLLTRAVDRHRNRIDYVYEGTDALNGSEVAYRLARIDYGFGPGGTGLPRRQVKFLYQSRPDPIVAYFRGVKLVTRSRLNRIEAWAPNPTAVARVWSYDLRYIASPDTGRSQLFSVSLCDKFAVQCSWTRKFAWTTASGGTVDETAMGDVEFDADAMSYGTGDLAWYNAPENQAANWLKPSDTRVLLYDMDGDGDDDALYRTQRSWVQPVFFYDNFGQIDAVGYNRKAGTLKVRLSAQDMPLSLMGYDVSALLEPRFGLPGHLDEVAYANLGKSRIADMDGDGQLDLVLARTQIYGTGETDGDNSYSYYDHWQFGFHTYVGRTWDHFADYPFLPVQLGLDTVAIEGPVLRFDLYSGRGMVLSTPAFQRVIADLDGDGRAEAIDSVEGADVLDIPEADYEDPYAFFEGGGHLYHTTLTEHGTDVSFAHSWTCGNGRAQVVDLDGDHRDDVLVASDMYSNDGEIDPVTGSPALYKRLSLSDPIDPTQPFGPAHVGGTAKLWAGGCDAETPDLVMGDWNGDGLVDALYPPGSYGGNTQPLVRWNLGRGGFAPSEAMPVTGAAGITALMEQPVPIGRQGMPVKWDRGTRVADVDGDGRSDIIAVRQDNTVCVDPYMAGGLPLMCENKVVVYRSQGDHFAGAQLFSWVDGRASLSEGFSTAQVGDVDGDGATDFVHVAGGKLRVLRLPWRTQPDLLAQVHDDGSAYPLEKFTYTRAWWGDRPRNEATAASPTGPATCEWPVTCPRGGATTVREHEVFAGTRPDGTAMRRRTFHTFDGRRASLIGRGDLGFHSHKSWQRESGVEVRRIFENQVELPPTASAGGRFYPRAGRPSAESTITPLLATPTAAELASASPGPGLVSNALTDVRVTSVSTDYEVRMAAGGHILTLLPSQIELQEIETQAAPDLSTGTPSYSAIGSGGGRGVTTTLVHDASGNVIDRTTELGGAAPTGSTLVTRRVKTVREDRPATWLLGLPTEIAQSSFDVDDADHPARIVRIAYDATPAANATSIEVRARGPLYGGCVALGLPPASCEDRASTLALGYDARGNPTTATTTAFDDPTPRTTALAWDGDGVYQYAQIDAAGFSTVSAVHPGLGVALTTTDANGVTTSATYDGFGRLRTMNRPGMAGLTRSYAQVINGNRRGLKISDVASDGAQTYSRTDELGRTIEVGNRAFGGVQWIYGEQHFDLHGNVAHVDKAAFSLAATAGSDFSYDRLGQRLAAVGPDGSTTVFDPLLLSMTTWDPEGHESYVVRDVAGRVVESGHRDGAGVAKGEVAFRYGPFDLVDRVTDAAGNETTMMHDGFGRLLRTDDPDTGVADSWFDGFGHVVQEQRDNGDVLRTTYDVLGRPLTTEGPDGAITRDYDAGTGAARKLTMLTSPDGVTTTFGYDALGRLHTTEQASDAGTFSTVQRYDQYGRLKYQFYPVVPGFARFTLEYKYGTDGYLREIDDASACLYSTVPDTADPACPAPPKLWEITGRDAMAALTTSVFGSGTTVTRGYEPDTGRLASVSAAGRTTAYTYYDDGQVQTRTDVGPDRVEEFSYDEMHRLTGWTLQGPRGRDGAPAPIDTGYRYDELGNLTQVMTGSTVAFAASYGWDGRPHAMASSTTAGTYTYDEVGRQVTGGGRETEWTQFDLPRSIETPTSDRLFTYDGAGHRVSAEDANSRIAYLGRLYEHRDTVAYGQMDTFKIYGEPGMVAQVDYRADGTKATRYVVTDSISSAALVVKSNGVPEEQAYFDPFGARVDALGAASADPVPSTSVGFGGHEADGAGLINMGGRIYDRAQYRFLSPDPILARPRFGQAYNPYSYVYNNPLNLVDPSGYSPKSGVRVEEDGTVVTWEYDWNEPMQTCPVVRDIADKGYRIEPFLTKYVKPIAHGADGSNTAPTAPTAPSGGDDDDDDDSSWMPDFVDYGGAVIVGIGAGIVAEVVAASEAMEEVDTVTNNILDSIIDEYVNPAEYPPDRAKQLWEQSGRVFENTPAAANRFAISVADPDGSGTRIITTNNKTVWHAMHDGIIRLQPNEVLGSFPHDGLHAEILGAQDGTKVSAGGVVGTYPQACDHCGGVFHFNQFPGWRHLNPNPKYDYDATGIEDYLLDE